MKPHTAKQPAWSLGKPGDKPKAMHHMPASLRNADAVVPEGVKVTRAPAPVDRYGVPDERVPFGFAAMGVGRYFER